MSTREYLIRSENEHGDQRHTPILATNAQKAVNFWRTLPPASEGWRVTEVFEKTSFWN